MTTFLPSTGGYRKLRAFLLQPLYNANNQTTYLLRRLTKLFRFLIRLQSYGKLLTLPK